MQSFVVLCACVFIVIWVLIRPDTAVMVDWALENKNFFLRTTQVPSFDAILNDCEDVVVEPSCCFSRCNSIMDLEPA